jgi:hypothetical protein
MLAGKTANPSLRALIENQLLMHAASAEVITTLAFSPLAQEEQRRLAAETLTRAISDPNPVPLLLAAGEYLFRAGAIDESLWLAYALQVIDPSPLASWKEHPVWHCLLPICALAYNPHEPYGTAKQLNDQLFSGQAEPAVAYLDLYESLSAAMALTAQFAGVEILKKVDCLLKLRPGDAALLYFKTQLLSGAQLGGGLIDTARQGLASSPFEAFMALEMNRFLLTRNQEMSLALRHNSASLYYKLHQWLPISRFWNFNLLSSLLPAAEHNPYLPDLSGLK